MWKIYVNYGRQEELNMVNELAFRTKKEACEWAKENGYPAKCVMREEEWQENKAKEEDLVIHF